MNLYVMSCFVVAGLTTFMILHPKYEDGLIGKLSLLCVLAGSLVVVGEYADGVEYDVNQTTLAVQFGIAVFLLRHVYRFNKWVKHGSFDWRKNEKDTPANDVVCPLLTSPRNRKKRRESVSPIRRTNS